MPRNPGAYRKETMAKKRLLADPTVFRTLAVVFTRYLPLENFENRLSGASLGRNLERVGAVLRDRVHVP